MKPDQKAFFSHIKNRTQGISKGTYAFIHSKEQVIDAILFFITFVRLFFNFIYGFRWPSEYVCSQNVFTYQYGFLPRAFIGTLLKLIFHENMYSYKANYIISIGTGLLLLMWFLFKAWYAAFKKKNIILLTLVMWYSLSIYSAYSAHEMGYFEQYGYLLIIFYVETVHKHGRYYIAFMGSILAVISVLISETNLFVICPIFFFVGLTELLRQRRELSIKTFFQYILFYIPCGLLGIVCNMYQANLFTILRLLSDLRKFNPGYKYAAGLGQFFLQDRIFWETRKRNDGSLYFPFSFESIPWQIAAFILIIVALMAAFLWMKNEKKVLYLYLTAAFIMFSASYSINFIALDLDRFRYCGVMMILFYSIYICHNSEFSFSSAFKGIMSYQKLIIGVLLIGSFLVLITMDYQLSLFENSKYNNNPLTLIETLRNMLW